MKAPSSVHDQIERAITVARRSVRFWRRGLAVALCALAAAAAFTFSRPRRYQSETVILYRETVRSADLTGGGDGAGAGPRRLGLRLREQLLSRASLEPIVKEFDLYPEIVERRSVVDAVDEMRKNVDFRAREGDTYVIAFTTVTAELAERVTARLGQSIVEEATRTRSESANTLREFLSGESARYNDELKAREAAMTRFVAEHPAYAALAKAAPGTELPPPPPPPAAPARPTDALLASLELRAARIDRRLHPNDPPPTAAGGTAGASADAPELVEARRDLAQKLTLFTEKHPDVVAARARIKELEAAAAQRRAESGAAPRSDAPVRRLPPLDAVKRDIYETELADLRRQIDQRRRTLEASGKLGDASGGGRTPALEAEFLRLSRELVDARERQRQVDERQFKATLNAKSVQDDRNVEVSILDKAFRPTHPVSTSRTPMMAVGMLLAALAGLLAALLSALLDDRIHDGGDVAALDLVPLLGVVPRPRVRRG